jgi:hypothetical protein
MLENLDFKVATPGILESEHLTKEKGKEVISAWEFGKLRSSYHFRTDIIDPRWDTVLGLGRFSGDWSTELKEAMETAIPVNIHTRRNYWKNRPMHQGNSNESGVKLNNAEYNDCKMIGGDDQRTIFRVQHDLHPVFQKMVDLIGLDDGESRLNVQYPTECFLGHVDRFDHNYPGVPLDELIRIGIMLTDWQQGHFFQFGNFPYQQWRAGDIHTFEYKHVPHYTANCGITPRVTLFTTGIITKKTREFLKMAKEVSAIEIMKQL